jgi:hypothetical protein
MKTVLPEVISSKVSLVNETEDETETEDEEVTSDNFKRTKHARNRGKIR